MTSTNELTKSIVEMNESGASRAKIEGFLLYAHDMSVNEAKDLVQKTLGKSTSTSSDWSETIEFIRKNFGKMDKKDLINGMCEIKNAKFSSMTHAYNYIRFAQEFARQEVEATKK